MSAVSSGEMTYIKQIPRRFSLTPPKREDLLTDSLKVNKVGYANEFTAVYML